MFPYWGIGCTFIQLVSAGNSSLTSIPIDYVCQIAVERRKKMALCGKKWVLISFLNRHADFDVFLLEVFFLICTLIWRVINYVCRQVKCVNRRTESTNERFNIRPNNKKPAVSYFPRFWLFFSQMIFVS